MTEPEQGRRRSRRLVYGFACSGALHGALLVIATFGSCLTGLAPTAASDTLVGVEIPPPVVPEPARMAGTTPPGGGVPVRHFVHLKRPPEPAEKPTPVVSGPPAAPVEPPLVAEATANDGVEVPADDAADTAAPPGPQAQSPDAGAVSAVTAATAAYGTGHGFHGGSGGFGQGAGIGKLPVVKGKLAFGGDTGDFRGVVCFFLPGIFRIADIHQCDPVAVLYTDTFNIPERQYADGFPGVTDRSSWFMVDYRGSFGVRQEGDYRFRLHSDDGAYLFIDDAMLIENDGKHEPMSRTGVVHLRSGRHQLKLLYAQTVERMALQLFVKAPGAWNEKVFRSEL